MVNILLVSHSYQLAKGTAELMRQMTPSAALKIRVAAGLGDDHSEIGTNAIEIMEALNELAEHDDVLVLMDLGSAVLSTEMALQMLDEDIASKVRMCPAPFVEGSIAACVQASLGSPIQEVYDEAMNALTAKQQQILGEQAVQKPVVPDVICDPIDKEQTEEQVELSVTVSNPSGLHARPAATFIQTVKKYDCQLTVTNQTNGTEPVVVKGMISVMLLAAKQGDELLLQASGPDRDALLAELKDLFLENFGE